MKESIIKVIVEIEKDDETNPEFIQKYKDKYYAARKDAGFKDDDHLPEVIEARENVRNMYSFITSISPGLNDNQYAAQQIVDIYFHEYVRMKYGKSEQ